MEKVAVVFGLEASAKITVPGPLTTLQEIWSVPSGSPSSTATPFKTAGLGKAMIWSGPAFTKGG
jgi:hypothetical protein